MSGCCRSMGGYPWVGRRLARGALELTAAHLDPFLMDVIWPRPLTIPNTTGPARWVSGTESGENREQMENIMYPEGGGQARSAGWPGNSELRRRLGKSNSRTHGHQQTPAIYEAKRGSRSSVSGHASEVGRDIWSEE